MTPDAERRQAWDQYAAAALSTYQCCAMIDADWAAKIADQLLAARDARFPAKDQTGDEHE